MVPVLCNVIGVNQDVIQVNYYAHVKEVREYIVYETLEGSWSISQSKWYYWPFEGSIVGPEGGFLFISFSNVDQVVRMLEVNFGVNTSLARRI